MTKPTLKSNYLEKHLSYSSHLNMNSLMSWLSKAVTLLEHTSTVVFQLAVLIDLS